MKTVFVTDNKPKTCDDCPFHQELLVPAKEEQAKYLNVVMGCYITNKEDGNTCPLIEDAAYFDTLDDTKEGLLYVDEAESTQIHNI